MNPFLAEHLTLRKTPQALTMREAEVECLRNELEKLKREIKELEKLNDARLNEVFCYRQKLQDSTTYLYIISQAVLAGEYEKAQEFAHKALDFIKIIEKSF